MKRAARALAAGGFALVLWLVADRARAVDPFEIQVYDGTANDPGIFGLELHLNHWATGHRSAVAPELPLFGQTHATLEPSFGVLPFWELGAYFQTSMRPDGTLDYAGSKLRSKFVTPPTWNPTWRLGVNFELAYISERYDPDRWGMEMRPIAAYDDQRWLVAFNPILAQSFGATADEGPSFEPALKGSRAVGPVALGLEYYVNSGPVASPLPVREQEHYLYGVVDLLAVERFELNVGFGAGLTAASEGVIGKVILGYAFEPSKAGDAKEPPQDGRVGWIARVPMRGGHRNSGAR